MARKHQLREQRAGTVINVTSKKQESEVIVALTQTVDYLNQKFGNNILLKHHKQWFLKDIVSELKQSHTDVDFDYHFNTSSIRPDGGFLYLEGGPDDDLSFPILISEVKN